MYIALLWKHSSTAAMKYQGYILVDKSTYFATV